MRRVISKMAFWVTAIFGMPHDFEDWVIVESDRCKELVQYLIHKLTKVEVFAPAEHVQDIKSYYESRINRLLNKYVAEDSEFYRSVNRIMVFGGDTEEDLWFLEEINKNIKYIASRDQFWQKFGQEFPIYAIDLYAEVSLYSSSSDAKTILRLLSVMNAQSRSGNFPDVYRVFRTLNPSVDDVDAIKSSLKEVLTNKIKNDFGDDWVQVKESDLEVKEEILLEYLVSKLLDLEALGQNSTGSSCMIESMKSLYTFSISRLLEQCSEKDSDFCRSVSRIVQLGVGAEENRAFVETISKNRIDNEWTEYEILGKLFSLLGFALKR